MASKAQKAANRANAKKSTGPRTQAGKEKSRLNALCDGLTGQVTTLSQHDRPIFEKLKTEHIADLAPKTLRELKLANAIAWDTWRLDHLRATEMNMYAQAAEDNEDPDSPDDPQIQAARAHANTFRTEAGRFDLMSLYETRMNRGIHRNLTALRELQTERRRIYERDRADEILVARANEIKHFPHQTAATPSPGGFVFSNEEIINAALRQRILEDAASLLKAVTPSLEYDPTITWTPDMFTGDKIRRMPPASADSPESEGRTPTSGTDTHVGPSDKLN